MKAVLRRLFERALARLALEHVIPAQVTCRDGRVAIDGEQIDLGHYRKTVVVALGKAAFQMVEAVAAIVSPHPLSGVASGIGPPGRTLPGFTYFTGGHPYPNRSSFQAGDAVADLLQEVTPQDLVVYLLSGGGSAICEKPIFPDIPVADYRAFYKLLVTSGLTIVDINFLRKHFSAIKGGRLTERACPARQVTLFVSDAPPGHPSNVASGPTMPDESSADRCYEIMRRARLGPRLPASIRRVFDEHRLPETPKPGAEIFRTSSWHCLLRPEDAVHVLVEDARRLGWVVEPDLGVDDECPLDRAVDHLFDAFDQLRRAHPGRTVAIVTGGEYSCPVLGDGVGGRNQAFVLACVPRIATRRMAILSAGTDGIDGTSPAAGAVADGATLARACAQGLDPDAYAKRSDSYGFFSSLGDALMTGPTGNNVRDLRILVSW